MSLNGQKTVFMLFFRRALAVEHLSISIDHTLIRPSQETVFLGFVLNFRLRWLPHFRARAITARRAFFGVMNWLRASWGPSRSRARFLFYSVVESILLYGCSLWEPLLANKSSVRGARAAQRPYLITAIRTFRSVSAEALLVASDTLPLDLRVAEITSRRYDASPGGAFSPSSLGWLSRDLVYPSGSISGPISLSVPRGPPWGGAADTICSPAAAPTVALTLPEMKVKVRQLLWSFWDREWASYRTGQCTRAFFPPASDSSALADIELSGQVVQVLTGHSLLWGHQFCFGFSDSPACACGLALERFLFFCPRFTMYRSTLRDACCGEGLCWPPPLCSLSRSRLIWEAVCLFVHGSR